MAIFCDNYTVPLMVEPFHEDSSGSLVGRAAVTCIGVFPYLQEDGTVLNVARFPDVVFEKASLDSLRMVPVTNDHPGELLTPDNTSKYQVGMTGEDVCSFDGFDVFGGAYKTDGTQVTIPLKITDKKAIEDVKAGKRGLSCGYTCEVTPKSGTLFGMHYDAYASAIRYNHVAICDKGRAGDTAVILMDSNNEKIKTFVPTYTDSTDHSVKVEDKSKKDNIKKEGDNMPKKLTIDSVAYEVDEKVSDAYEAVLKERDSLQGKLDAANVQIDSLKTEMATMIKADSLADKVKEYSDVRKVADSYGVSLDDGMSILDMKKAVLKKAIPSMADSIDSKSEDYVNGAFGTCSDMAPAKKEEDPKKKEEEEPADKKNCKKDSNDSADDKEVSVTDAVNERLAKKFGNR